VEFLGEVAAWFSDPASWSGNNSIPLRLWEHLSLSGASLALGALIALPAGLAIGHTGRGAGVVVAIANIGRAIPSLGWLGIALPITLTLFQRGGLGFLPALVALVALAVPPMVTNTHTGLREVDRELVDAARGMGMSERQVLWRVEVPIALPVILAGVRSAAVQVVATATLAAVVAGGTLGDFILQGIYVRDLPRVFGAALMVAVLALLTEGLFALLQRAATPRGLRVVTAVEVP
jgi:osmoprotectant transport system permease protein